MQFSHLTPSCVSGTSHSAAYGNPVSSLESATLSASLLVRRAGSKGKQENQKNGTVHEERRTHRHKKRDLSIWASEATAGKIATCYPGRLLAASFM